MALTGDQWHRLALGEFDVPVRAFGLKPVLSVRLGVGTISVWIKPRYVQKIRFKHKTPPEMFEHIPSIANGGEAFLDGRSPFCLNMFGTIGNRRYKLVLKGIPHVNEIWIATFHCISEREYRRYQRKLARV